LPRRTFRVVDQKTNQLAENQEAMPLSSNRAKSRTPLSSLVAGKEATNSLNNFSPGNTKKTATTKAEIPTVPGWP
jgi:hypothetical protein